MKKGFNLSKKRDNITKRFGLLYGGHIAMLEEFLKVVDEQDKEFIKLLKEIPFDHMDYWHIEKKINELAGDKLNGIK